MYCLLDWLKRCLTLTPATSPDSEELEARRSLYACGDDFYALEDIPPWRAHYEQKRAALDGQRVRNAVPVDQALNRIVSVWHGDLTALEIDAIVTPASDTLLGGGGVDSEVHAAAGHELKDHCRTLNGLRLCDTKITPGFRLPASRILHTVAPRFKDDQGKQLKTCYDACLHAAADAGFRTIAFPSLCIGRHAHSIEESAPIAVSRLRCFLHRHRDNLPFKRVIFCLKDIHDFKAYESTMLIYFPVVDTNEIPLS